MSIYYKISAPAKLNLNLFVGDKFLDGLHFLESDICFLELIDKIYLKFSNDDTFYQRKNNTFMINPKKNLIFQAIQIFRSYTKWEKNLRFIFTATYFSYILLLHLNVTKIETTLTGLRRVVDQHKGRYVGPVARERLKVKATAVEEVQLDLHVPVRQQHPLRVRIHPDLQ